MKRHLSPIKKFSRRQKKINTQKVVFYTLKSINNPQNLSANLKINVY